MLRSLMGNPDFLAALKAKLCMLAREVFTPERCQEALDAYESMMGEALQKAHVRYYGKPLKDAAMEEIRAFLAGRQRYILETYGDGAGGIE